MKKKIIAAVMAAVLSFGISVPVSDSQTISIGINAEAASDLKAPVVTAKAGDGKITLSWPSVKGAEAYRVYMYDAKTKKYKKLKSVKNNSVAIGDLKNGTTYKFKVAAMRNVVDSYEVGPLSEAVSCKPAKAAPTKEMKAVSLKAEDMIGTWTFYDFCSNFSYKSGSSYNPDKKHDDSEASLTQIAIIATNYYIVSLDEDADGGAFTDYDVMSEKLSTKQLNTSVAGKLNYKIYQCGNDYYMFIQWKSKHTYIMKYNACYAATDVTKSTDLKGTWKHIDTLWAIKYDEGCLGNYVPTLPTGGHDFANSGDYTSIKIKDNKKAQINISGGWYTEENISTKSHTIGKLGYTLKMINGKTYMFLENTNDGYYYITDVFVLSK